MACQNPPDLVILDVIMRGMDGYAVCRAIRSEPSIQETPVLFLTAKIRPEDKISGFRAGADDYLCKPFNLDELLLRVHAILRRTMDPARWASTIDVGLKTNQPAYEKPPAMNATSSLHYLVIGDYQLDTHTYELTTPARGKVRLTPLQYDLLYHLMTHPGETFSPARLLNEVWDYPVGKGSPDLVRVHVKTLRERIEQNPVAPTFLRTIPGKGYTVSIDSK